MKTYKKIQAMTPKDAPSVTVSTTSGNILLLTTNSDLPPGDGWEEIKVGRLTRLKWRLVNAWDALCGREPST